MLVEIFYNLLTAPRTVSNSTLKWPGRNRVDERKAVWKGLDRTLTEAGSNDDLITELEITEALLGLSKNAAPGPDKIKYSDIKNLSVDNKSELFRLYEESFATGQVP